MMYLLKKDMFEVTYTVAKYNKRGDLMKLMDKNREGVHEEVNQS